MEFYLPEPASYILSFSGNLPARYRGPVLPGAEVRFAAAAFGFLLSQRLPLTDFNLQLDHFSNRHRRLRLLARPEHPLIALRFMLRGAMVCRPAGSGKALLAEGKYGLLYLPSQLPYQVETGRGETLSLQVELSLALFRDLAAGRQALQRLLQNAQEGSRRGILQDAAPIGRREKTLIEEMLACREEEPAKSLYLGSRVLDLLHWYLKDRDDASRRSQTASGLEKIMELVKEYIRSHLDEPLTAAFLARHFRISVTALKRGFRKLTSRSLHRYIQEQRMAKARQLLLETEMPMNEIAGRVGFPDPSHFGKVFRRFHGCTPLQYRKGINGPGGPN